MPWFAVSVVFYAKVKGPKRARVSAQERLYILRARNLNHARRSSRRLRSGVFPGNFPIGRENRSATWRFGGVRKVLECIGPRGLVSLGSLLQSQTEIYSSLFVAGTRKDIRRFVEGAPVQVEYLQQGDWR